MNVLQTRVGTRSNGEHDMKREDMIRVNVTFDINGCVSVQAPDNVLTIVRDYNVPDDWDEDNTRSGIDEDGGRYEDLEFAGPHGPAHTGWKNRLPDEPEAKP